MNDDEQQDTTIPNGNVQSQDDPDTPFSPPDDVNPAIDKTHPSTDTNIDETEKYQAGLGEAAQAFDPEKADPTMDDETELMADTH